MTDQEARQAIMERFYEAYQQGGLHVILNAGAVADELKLDGPQARRCFDYLAAKGFLEPMTLGGGYGPTVELVDEVESTAERN